MAIARLRSKWRAVFAAFTMDRENARPALFTEFHSGLGADFEDLDVVRGIGAVGEITPAHLIRCLVGEMLSSELAAAFVAPRLHGVHVDSRQCLLTDSSYTRAVPQFDETNERLQKRVKRFWDGKVPGDGSFIGSNRAGVTTTIGVAVPIFRPLFSGWT